MGIDRRVFLAAAAACLSKAALAQAPSKQGPRDPLAGGAITTPSGNLPPGIIPRSEQFDLKSGSGKTYTIKIGFPHVVDPDLKLEIKNRKPTAIYIVDGQSFFGLATDMTRFMQWGGDVPPCLIVAIQYPTDDEHMIDKQRTYDLTPTSSTYRVSTEKNLLEIAKPGPQPSNESEHRGGGGPQFLSFITGRVKPLIEKKYGLDPQDSVLAGHSFGGLFTIDAITRQPAAFRHYLAMSPSLWWDRKVEFKLMSDALANGFHSPGRLAIFAGSREERIGGPIASMAGNVVSLKQLLHKYPRAFDATHIEVLPDEDHHTVQAISLARGLRFLLTNNLAARSA